MTQDQAHILRGLMESPALRDAIEAAMKDESAAQVNALINAARDGNQLEAAKISAQMDAYGEVMNILDRGAQQYRVSRE